MHGVDATGVADHVGCRINQVGVVAKASGQGVVAGATIEGVVTRATSEDVDQFVAGERGVASTGEQQVFYAKRQGVDGHAAAHGVGAAGGHFHHLVCGVIHEIGVVAKTAGHAVCTSATIQRVDAAVAGERVIE